MSSFHRLVYCKSNLLRQVSAVHVKTGKWNRRCQSDECVSKASAVVLPSFEETVEQTRLSIWREALHSGGVDVHSFM